MTYTKVSKTFTTTYTHIEGELIVHYTSTSNRTGKVTTGTKGIFETEQDAKNFIDDL